MNVIGSRVFASVENHGPIPAKIDTGADSSSIWASDARVENGELSLVLFDKSSEFYTGQRIYRKKFSTTTVKSSNGMEETRYVTHLHLVLQGRRIRARFTLADRSNNRYPVLIGRRTLNKKFLVDVSQGDITPEPPRNEIEQGVIL